jgi:hypothetical protein
MHSLIKLFNTKIYEGTFSCVLPTNDETKNDSTDGDDGDDDGDDDDYNDDCDDDDGDNDDDEINDVNDDDAINNDYLLMRRLKRTILLIYNRLALPSPYQSLYSPICIKD